MKPEFRLLLIAVLFFASVKMHGQKPFSIGEIHTLSSTVLHEERTLNVYLPSDYNPAKIYTPIYVLDGSANEDFVHIAGLVQFFKMTYPFPDCIVIGIANKDRQHDFTSPTKLTNFIRPVSNPGGSEAFIRFMETEVQPFVKRTYKVNDTSMLIGQSLGGLVAVEMLLKKPGLFTHYFIVSPSLWWDGESLLKSASTLLSKQSGVQANVSLSVGAQEDTFMQRQVRDLAGVLIKPQRKNIRLMVDY